MASDVLYIIASVLFFVGTIIITIFYFERKNVTSKNSKEIRYSSERQYFEDKLLEINIKLNKMSDRWVDANHLIVDAIKQTRESIIRPDLNLVSEYNVNFDQHRFLQTMGINKDSLVSDMDVFILMPIHSEFNNQYKAIKSASDFVGLKSFRVDEKFLSTSILREVIISIVSAKLIVCLIDGRSPNVFYELGIAHALDKNVLILTEYLDEVPFDIQSNKLIVYRNDEDLFEKLFNEFKKITTIKELK